VLITNVSATLAIVITRRKYMEGIVSATTASKRPVWFVPEMEGIEQVVIFV